MKSHRAAAAILRRIAAADFRQVIYGLLVVGKTLASRSDG